MSQDKKPLSKRNIKISVMQREFTVACDEGEEDGLFEAAAYLDRQMRLYAEKNQVLGVDRCAIMAGLNISHSLLLLQKTQDQKAIDNLRLEKLHEQVNQVVVDLKQVY